MPVTLERLRVVDPELRLFTHHLKPFLARLDDWTPPAPFRAPTQHVDSRAGIVSLRFASESGGAATIAIKRPGDGVAGTDRFSLHVESKDASPVRPLVEALLAQLCSNADARITHPVGDEIGRRIDHRIGACISRLRARAPFGALLWRDVRVIDEGRGATVSLTDPDGVGVTVRFAVSGANVAGGYQLDRVVEKPSAELVDGVRAVMAALRAG